MDMLEFQAEMMLGKEIRIYFQDGSSCLANCIEDIVVTEKYAERYETVSYTHLTLPTICSV